MSWPLYMTEDAVFFRWMAVQKYRSVTVACASRPETPASVFMRPVQQVRMSRLTTSAGDIISTQSMSEVQHPWARASPIPHRRRRNTLMASPSEKRPREHWRENFQPENPRCPRLPACGLCARSPNYCTPVVCDV